MRKEGRGFRRGEMREQGRKEGGEGVREGKDKKAERNG